MDSEVTSLSNEKKEKTLRASSMWFDGFHYNNKFYYTAVIGAYRIIVKNSVSEYTRNRGELKGLLDAIDYASNIATLDKIFVNSDYLMKVFSVHISKLMENPRDRSVPNKEYVCQCIRNIGGSNVLNMKLTNPHGINKVTLQLHLNRSSLISTMDTTWRLHLLSKQPNIDFED